MGARELYGRSRELAIAAEVLARASQGHGGTVVLVGEAGIGKTALAGRVADDADALGFRVAWGRCWEAGGAPPYWPWSEVFRSLVGTDVFSDAHTELDAPELRFRRFETARDQLIELSRATPLLIILDDLHVSDLPSLAVLHLVARSIGQHRIALVCCYRDIDARTAREASALLDRIGREAQIVPLRRLAHADVETWVRAIAPELGSAAAATIHAATEGNPLFVRELLATGGAAERLPSGLRAVIDDHLARVPAEVSQVLAAGAVLGRSFSASEVARLTSHDPDHVARLLQDARDAGIVDLVDARPQQIQFAHVLLRDVLYTRLPAPERRALHWRAGECSDAIAIAAHHLLEGCDSDHAPRAAETARDAATAVMARLAFETAEALATRALEALGAHGKIAAHATLACELEILRAEATIRAGDVAAGKERCVRAAGVAREIRSPALEARAALAYGAHVISGGVDPTMVALLRGALRALPTDAAHEALHVRVMARLSAAMLPTRSIAEAREAMGLAMDAVERARQLDRETLLFASYYATHSVSYLLPTAERFELVRSVVQLATELQRDVTLLNVGPWWIANLCEQGQRAEAASAIEGYAARLRELRPDQQWRLCLVRALVALLDGKLDEAARHGELAREVAERAGSGLGLVGWAHHRIALARLDPDPGRVASDADAIIAALAPLPACAAAVTWVLARSGRTDQARAALARLAREATVDSVLLQDWLLAGEAAVLLEDRPCAAQLLPIVSAAGSRAPMFWGMPHGTAAIGPAELVLAELARLLGRSEDAARSFHEAIARCERMAAPGLADLAHRRFGARSNTQVARDRPTRPRDGERLRLVRDGDVWSISSFTSMTVRLKHAKGVEYLDHLVRRPDEAVHVAELFGALETGDAGEVLDRDARRAYKRRVDELRAELDEAERFADLGRVERARHELAALTEALVGATGITGRDRRAGSVVQRTRINVQRRLRATIEQISQQDPVLGRYLEAAVQTGTYCVYRPL